MPSLLLRTLPATLALGAFVAPSVAQVSYTPITPVGQFNQAIGISPSGEYVCGGGASNGFVWSQVGGLQTGFGAPAELWDVTDDGGTVAGVFTNGGGNGEAGVWTSGSGLTFLGNPGGASGCDAFLSQLHGLSNDGTTAVGMSWQVCDTWPMRWTQGVGLSLMAKQNPDESARASALSDDGVVAVGWDQGKPGGAAGNRRACIWTDDATQVFPATTPGNPDGLGECTDVNSDGSVVCGTTLNQAFRWTPGGGLELLPPVPGFGGQYVANGISEDGSVVAGVRLQFPTAEAILWTPETGAVRMIDFLTAAGVGGVGSGDVRNATGVSADGTRICGWGNNGAWVVDITKVWEDLGKGLAGTHGVPQLQGIGTLVGGTLVRLSLSGALENAPVALVVGLTALDAPFKGGVMVPNPDVLVIGLASNPNGDLLLTSAWPAGLPSGLTFYFQEWITDAAGPAGFAATNGLSGTTP